LSWMYTSSSAFEVEILVRLCITTFPAAEKTLSELAEEAGMHKMDRANEARNGTSSTLDFQYA
jgi:hypothetical protein